MSSPTAYRRRGRRIEALPAEESAPVLEAVLFDDPPALYRLVDLAALPGSPEELIPLEIEASLPYPTEDCLLAFAPTGKRNYLVAAVPRAPLEKALAAFRGTIRQVVPRPLAHALALRPSGAPAGEVQAGGYRFVFEGKRLVGADVDLASAAGEAPASALASPEEIGEALRRGSPLNFARALGRAPTRARRTAFVAASASLLLALGLAGESMGLSNRVMAAREETRKHYQSAFPGQTPSDPLRALERKARDLEPRIETMEAVLTKKDSVLTRLARITAAAAVNEGGAPAGESADRPILVRDLRILEDRVEIAGWAATSEAAERFRDRMAGVEDLGVIEGPELRSAGTGYDFRIQASLPAAPAPAAAARPAR